MASDAVVRAHIAGEIEDKAAKVLAGMGLPVCDAIRLSLVYGAPVKARPFLTETASLILPHSHGIV